MISPTAAQTGGLSLAGDVTAAHFHGDGSALTNLSGAALAAGSVPDAALSANVAHLASSPTFTGAGGVTAPLFTGKFSGDGSALTNLGVALGVIGVSGGGTGLGAPGAAGNFLRSSGAAWTSAALSAADVPAGSASYVQAQGTSAQSASFNVSGSGRVGGALVVGGTASFASVGIGTSTPATPLEVAGAIHSTSGGFVFPDGTTQTTAAAFGHGAVAQMIVNTSAVTASLDATAFTEVNPAYRVALTPAVTGSKVLVEFDFSMNQALAPNTVHHLELVRNIGGVETLVGVGPANGSRNRVSWVGRPGNGYDNNDAMTVHLVGVDTGLTPGTPVTYGFKYRHEQHGSGTCYFNASSGDDFAYGWSGVMTMKATEIAP